ncbi:MAG: L,D-transpeptidase [Chloroflexi bacterium]|nr:L,D-transpeptidase [Chloroflexota bacterium]
MNRRSIYTVVSSSIRRLVYVVTVAALSFAVFATSGSLAQADSSLTGNIGDVTADDTSVAGNPAAMEAVEGVYHNIVNAAAVKGKWIEVILSKQKLIAWQDGRAVMSSLISSGTSRHPTRRGTFRVYVKYRATRMRGPGYDLPGVPYTMYYSGSYAVHGAYWHNNFGHPMSHGCVNLPVAFSQRLYAWAPVGTPVVVH